VNGLFDELRIAAHSIWMRRWLALGVAWAVAIVGWLFVAQIPSSYESTARVFAQMQTILPAAVGITPADQQKDLDTVRQTLTSADNLEKVVRGTDLANTVATDKDVADRVAALQPAVKITSEQDNTFTISVAQRSPKIARQVVQKLLDLFVEQNLSGDKAETTSTLQFLDQQLAQKQKQLQDAETKREAFQNQFLGSLPGTGSIADRLAAARVQMSQVDSDLAAAQSSLAVVNGQMAGTPASVPGVGGTAGSAGPARARLAAIQGQLADARARGYTEQHPDVIALKSQLAAAQAAARNEPLVGGTGAGAGASNPLYLQLKSNQADKQAQVAAALSRKRQLQGDIDAISAKLTGDSSQMQEQSQIERDYQVLKDSYDKLLGDREDVRLRGQAQSQTDQIKFSVLDQPSAPRVPTSPNRPLLLTGVLIAALAVGGGAAFAMTQVQTTFPTAKRLEAATGLSVIGSIGEAVTKVQIAQRRRQLGYFGGGAAALVVAWVALLGVEMLQRGLAA
jgi:polysaccharide chain length determinant protein (PEP-CTERM system associated)